MADGGKEWQQNQGSLTTLGDTIKKETDKFQTLSDDMQKDLQSKIAAGWDEGIIDAFKHVLEEYRIWYKDAAEVTNNFVKELPRQNAIGTEYHNAVIKGYGDVKVESILNK